MTSASNEKELKSIASEEVAEHNSEESCWVIVGNASNGGPKVYDITSYLDDHPGGAEVLLDVAGQDADEFFEDIGHSKDARNELKKYLIGTLHLTEEELAKRSAAASSKVQGGAANGGSSMMLILLIVVLAVLAGYYYK